MDKDIRVPTVAENIKDVDGGVTVNQYSQTTVAAEH